MERDPNKLIRKQIEIIEATGKKARGRKEWLAALNGSRISDRQAILAKCYDCQGMYDDGTGDCKTITCPLYSKMPYNPNKTKKVSTLTEDQRKAAGDRMKNIRRKEAETTPDDELW
jgi:uncharacterized membrane protein